MFNRRLVAHELRKAASRMESIQAADYETVGSSDPSDVTKQVKEMTSVISLLDHIMYTLYNYAYDAWMAVDICETPEEYDSFVETVKGWPSQIDGKISSETSDVVEAALKLVSAKVGWTTSSVQELKQDIAAAVEELLSNRDEVIDSLR